MRVLASLLVLAACGRSAAGRAPATDREVVVLERTPCFGACPAYRLGLRESGAVRFESRAPGDSGRVATASVPAASVAALVARAERDGFFRLPPVIERDSALCPRSATDNPTAVVTVARGGAPTRVEHYQACVISFSPLRVAEPVARLRALEEAIDSVAGTTRWTRPGERR